MLNAGGQDVLKYLTRKRRLARNSTANLGALLLVSQCIQLARLIWSQNRSLIQEEYLVDLLVQHAEISIELVYQFIRFFSYMISTAPL